MHYTYFEPLPLFVPSPLVCHQQSQWEQPQWEQSHWERQKVVYLLPELFYLRIASNGTIYIEPRQLQMAKCGVSAPYHRSIRTPRFQRKKWAAHTDKKRKEKQAYIEWWRHLQLQTLPLHETKVTRAIKILITSAVAIEDATDVNKNNPFAGQAVSIIQ